MDALRFVRAAAAPASVPPPTMPAQQRRQRQHALLLRLWPRGRGDAGGEKPAAAGGAVRGAEPRSSPPPEEEREAEAGGRGQGNSNWVLQMLRVQPRWADAADVEATGGGGGGREPEGEEAEAAGGGVEECASCGAGGEDEGCAVGYDEGEVFDRASFSRLLRKTSLGEAKEYSMMSYLCNIAYMIPRIQVTSSSPPSAVISRVKSQFVFGEIWSDRDYFG